MSAAEAAEAAEVDATDCVEAEESCAEDALRLKNWKRTCESSEGVGTWG